jgi:hypothetical protein
MHHRRDASFFGQDFMRYIHPDAGHACQNLECRFCSGVCAIAAFSDDFMNDLFELDGVERLNSNGKIS